MNTLHPKLQILLMNLSNYLSGDITTEPNEWGGYIKVAKFGTRHLPKLQQFVENYGCWMEIDEDEDKDWDELLIGQ